MLTVELLGDRSEAILGMLRKFNYKYDVLLGSNPPAYFLIRLAEGYDETLVLAILVSAGDAFGVEVNEHP